MTWGDLDPNAPIDWRHPRTWVTLAVTVGFVGFCVFLMVTTP